MNWLSWVLLIAFMGLAILSRYLQRRMAKESFQMTVTKFKAKVDALSAKNDYSGLQNFLKNHLFFIMLHSAELTDCLNAINSKFADQAKKSK